MPNDIPSLSFAPDLPFVYVGGDPSFDLVNSVDWTAGGLEMDRLSSYERLTWWAEGAGIVLAEEGKRLRLEGGERPEEAVAAYRDARRLRLVLHRLYQAVAAGSVAGALFDDFNDVLEGAMGQLEVAGGGGARGGKGGVVRWVWRDREERLDSPLWPVVRSAAELLVSEGARVRVCAGEGCGWTFVDRSRNGLRRWCQMEVCGTREKSRRRSSRR